MAICPILNKVGSRSVRKNSYKIVLEYLLLTNHPDFFYNQFIVITSFFFNRF
jgi:hypothetical protein